MAFDASNPTQVAELKDEVITTNPLVLPYNWTTGDTNQVLNTINAKNYTVQQPTIMRDELVSAVTVDAYDGLLAPETGWLDFITKGEVITVTTDLLTALTGNGTPTNSIWAVGERTEMIAAMDAIINVPGSRAEVLWGFGTSISRTDWFAARDS